MNHMEMFFFSPESKTIMNARLPWPATLTLPSDYRPEVLKVLKDNDPTKVTGKFRRAFILCKYFLHFFLVCSISQF